MASRGKRFAGLTSDGSDYEHRQKVESHYEIAGQVKSSLAMILPFGLVHVVLGVVLSGIIGRFSVSAVAPAVMGGTQCAMEYTSRSKTLRNNRLAVMKACIALGGIGIVMGVWAIGGLFTSTESGLWSRKEWDYLLGIVISVCVLVQGFAIFWGNQLLKAWRQDRRRSR